MLLLYLQAGASVKFLGRGMSIKSKAQVQKYMILPLSGDGKIIKPQRHQLTFSSQETNSRSRSTKHEENLGSFSPSPFDRATPAACYAEVLISIAPVSLETPASYVLVGLSAGICPTCA